MSWRGQLALRYRREGDRTVAHDRHDGPLRVLQALYPEGPGICQHVLVHPPGGIVGGDELQIDAELGAGTHALVTTPGATRFYRSTGAMARQAARLVVEPGARLEWLPLETLAYPDCIAENRTTVELRPGGEAMGWEVLALGLPASAKPFDRGRFVQHLEVPGQWLDRGAIDAADTLLLDGAPGLAGERVIATMWFASGEPLPRARRDELLDAARAAIEAAGCVRAGATSPASGVVVLRALGQRVEPLMTLLLAVRSAWRTAAWGLAAHPPRIWRM